MLVNNRNTKVMTARRIEVLDDIAEDLNLAFIRLQRASDHTHQCRLTGAVFAEQGMNLAWLISKETPLRAATPSKCFHTSVTFSAGPTD